MNDPSSAQDGFQCACFGKDALGSVTASCYRGVCDYGTFFFLVKLFFEARRNDFDVFSNRESEAYDSW